MEESGTTNLFFVINGKVLTPNLHDTILKGITRDSYIKILESKEIEVEQRKISVKEIVEAAESGMLGDAFGTSTAALIAKIESININGKDYKLPPVAQRKISNLLYNTLEDIRTSKEEDEFGWMERV